MTTRGSISARVSLAVLLLFAGFAALTLSDHWIWAHVKVTNVPDLEKKDWYQFLRQLGTLYPWAAASLMLLIHDVVESKRTDLAPTATRPPYARALLLFLSPALGGAAAELVKQVVRRLRPGETGEYLYGWTQGVPHGPYGMASSHAAVAFGAAFMLSRLFPKTWPITIPLACGCALTRLLAGAHFATDTYAAAIMSYAVAAVLWKLTHKSTPTQEPGLRTKDF